MKITMLDTRRGSEDGFAVRRFHKGTTYEVGEGLARSFIRQGWATAVEPPSLFDTVKGIVTAFDAGKS
ncbi:hypothetical protein ACYOEI_00330 [Singulisphaera rosea]